MGGKLFEQRGEIDISVQEGSDIGEQFVLEPILDRARRKSTDNRVPMVTAR